ncbi:MAG: hypothetical protein A3I07_00955 [Candidatus Doudnabacteria bacterium RIFCSPLOWO2_02_FULL_42_9]|uniref:PDZ domain-containing protein n=1 Tax=Candidatus Doudnabacteria bacterium RIFCSPHIGHO2_01_FULL_41_86 TaxID=1817821 RepID=A0A1F5N9I9_9BACT|nr:MAG: hypothetical protein A2717_01590 [Candidatus Doudnabacteria bacterium RIFCSPHIGHO2_01_FULL_41_86]OGE75032.1 MAG: hypothetical protein A3K07_04660 [Candidatus Doudnabacteria bacterium RIFCSPHIGHO2_01_43_10]OGE85261.1 MAG: hypothetical protein A3E28_01160 [Candidatus Doudnabacteria bacterium RIFCSPHIGHO2_12_FULL_42_22]OGE86799.1 MAG: hypothetical protein A3C49_01995 [Candidatus Doudnabacteria bacterium RIFCSPHIGHO2_02_FULL_42_25]OGE92398.1 MAG: hypothetical protein A2895_02150 [Candidatus
MSNSNEDKSLLPSFSEVSDKSDQNHLKLLGVVALLSFLFGIAGAVFGSAFLGERGLSITSLGDVRTVSVDESSAVIDVVNKSSPAVVSIIVSKDLNKIPGYSTSPFNFGPIPDVQEIGGGTGFIITDDGLIMTNKHVVEDTTATYTVLTTDGKKYDATVLSRDPVNDIALVKIDASGLPTLILGDSANLEIGQSVIAIGNSLGQYQNTVTTGVVSGIGRSITASGGSTAEQLEGVIQTDAAINPGNSGGPLLDIGGSVIGINTAIDSQGQLLGFAIPINDAKRDLDSFRKFGRIVKPFLGIRYVLINQTLKEENNLEVDYGALIVSGGTPSNPAVIPGSAADKAGLRENDIILEINGKKIEQENSLAAELKNFNPDDQVTMKILSRGEEKTITVTLGESK